MKELNTAPIITTKNIRIFCPRKGILYSPKPTVGTDTIITSKQSMNSIYISPAALTK